MNKKIVNALAAAGAFASISRTRFETQWQALGIERLPGMLKGLSATEENPRLRAPTEAQDITWDYRSMGLTLRRHPLAVLRPKLDQLRVRSTTALKQMRPGRTVRIAGLVTHRQRPATASGVMFVSLEDETGISNIIVWNTVQDEQREHLLRSQLMIVEGKLQNQDGVVHVVASKIRDYSHWLGALDVPSRDFH